MSSPSTVTLLCHHIIIIFVTIIVHQYQMHKFIDHNLWYTYFGRSIFHTDFTISPFLSFPMFFFGGGGLLKEASWSQGQHVLPCVGLSLHKKALAPGLTSTISPIGPSSFCLIIPNYQGRFTEKKIKKRWLKEHQKWTSKNKRMNKINRPSGLKRGPNRIKKRTRQNEWIWRVLITRHMQCIWMWH